MKGEQVLRRLIARSDPCPEWDKRQNLCMSDKCGCIERAKKYLDKWSISPADELAEEIWRAFKKGEKSAHD